VASRTEGDTATLRALTYRALRADFTKDVMFIVVGVVGYRHCLVSRW
jgi:hypothetical protein